MSTYVSEVGDGEKRRHLEGVRYGKEPGKDRGIVVESEETKQPGESQ